MGSFVYHGGLNPGSQTITATGAGSFEVPVYTSKLRVRMHGAGGGGLGHNGTVGVSGATGGSTTFSAPSGTLTAGGGGGAITGTNGAGGTASGGDVNTSGDPGLEGASQRGGAAGSTANGGGAAALGPGANGPGTNGNIYGGGGSGARTEFGQWHSGGGAAFCEKVYPPGELNPQSSISYSVGAGGLGGNSTLHDGGNGANGALVIEWDYE